MRVLVVEDNALLRHHLKVQIQDAGHQVDDAEDAKEADYYLNEHIPDIAIVDLGLPDEDGLSLIRRWRSNDVSLPILVLTARESWQDKVEVLSAGADDYVTKPFHIEEVMARMQALMRRNSGLASQVISLPPFQVDLSRRELSINEVIPTVRGQGYLSNCADEKINASFFPALAAGTFSVGNGSGSTGAFACLRNGRADRL